jgi:formamidopyrimidine-DNA glycosylase
MPELPEVETIRRGLERRLCGAKIAEIEIREARLRRPLDVASLRRIVGRTIRSVGRRGKYLLFDVGEGLLWLAHLGMSGQLLLTRVGAPAQPHEHLRVRLEPPGVLVYRDARRFGWMRVGRAEELEELRRLGPEPLGEEADLASLPERLRSSRRSVKAALLDQATVAGIGNIYANEILFRAGIRPFRRGCRLRRDEAARIVRAMREVLAEAIARRGTSFSDYLDSEGAPGAFQHELSVFGREGLPCRRCGCPIRRRVHLGRSTFYCVCQR